jgi:hypothetical protein
MSGLYPAHSGFVYMDNKITVPLFTQWRNQEFFFGGFQQIQLKSVRTEIWGAVAPYSGVLEAAIIWYKKCNFI